MRTNLLSKLKVKYLDSLHQKEAARPYLVKSVLTVLEDKCYVGDLTISETIDITMLSNTPTNDYNYIWEMFNEN